MHARAIHNVLTQVGTVQKGGLNPPNPPANHTLLVPIMYYYVNTKLYKIENNVVFKIIQNWNTILIVEKIVIFAPLGEAFRLDLIPSQADTSSRCQTLWGHKVHRAIFDQFLPSAPCHTLSRISKKNLKYVTLWN